MTTADGSGRARVVLVKQISADGIAIGFSAASRKGRDLSANPRAALTFYWRECARQITVGVTVRRAAPELSDRLFSGRPRPAQALATHSHQSKPLADAKPSTGHPSGPLQVSRANSDLHSAVDALVAAERSIDRPEGWSALIIALDEIELWHGSTARFHRRLHYLRLDDAPDVASDARANRYQVQRLQP